MPLIRNGDWKIKTDLVTFNSSIVYFKLDDFVDGDEIEYMDENNVQQSGWAWHEMYDNASPSHEQMVARDALSVIAAFISHVDNFDGNQGLICLYDKVDDIDITRRSKQIRRMKTKDSCDGTPMVYIHDVGGTLGAGWNLRNKNFWPNYMDRQQWFDVSAWNDGDSAKCDVYVNGIPGCSWNRALHVSEEGRALAASLLGQITDKQIVDLFTAARANLMRGDAVEDWIQSFHDKLNRDVFNAKCTV